MASGTGTTKPDGIFSAISRSRIARIIFIWNFAGLAFLILGVLLLILRRSPPPAPPPEQAGENTMAAKPEASSGGEKGEKPPAVNPPPNAATEGKNPAGTGATKSGAASRNRGTPKKDARARGAKKPSIKIIN